MVREIPQHFEELDVIIGGGRISIGQAVVRQLPLFFEIFWVDVLFALFTDKSQRAFELLSKTRVVRVEEPVAPRINNVPS